MKKKKALKMRLTQHLLLVLWTALLATAVAAQDSYQIRPGDTLTIEVLEDPGLNRQVLVLPDGQFSFPFAGSVRASGLTTDQVAQSIVSTTAPNFASGPTVFVTVAALRQSTGSSGPRTIDIFFVGEVNTPGAVALPPGTTFLQALASSGGFTQFAATKRVQVRRINADGTQSVFTVDYNALADGNPSSHDFGLMDGDVILVSERRLFE